MKQKFIVFIKIHKLLIGIIFVFFLLRLINITLLPIFNDESIYLDWGWRETHSPGMLFYSLYDGKQPLLMWIFGIFESFIKDPVIAGRIVSIFCGFLTLTGLYYFTDKYLNKKTALLTCLIYVITPFFSFYDRQALMESAVAAVGVWVLVFIYKLTYEKLRTSSLISLGIILGLGYFIKSSALVFLVTYIITVTASIFFKMNNISIQIKNMLLVLLSFLSVTFLLLINDEFWRTIGRNSLYVLTFSEVISFPLKIWFANFLGNLEISFFHLSPLIFLGTFLGLFLVIFKKFSKLYLLLTYFLFGFVINTLTTRITYDRYLVSFLPLVCIFVAYLITYLYNKQKNIGVTIGALIMCSALIITLVSIINPIFYISSIAKYTKYNQLVYLDTYTSGYGVKEAYDYLKELQKPLVVAVALNTGNPESAMLTYFRNDANVRVIYLDGNAVINYVRGYSCLKFDKKVYFVARNNQLNGLEKYFIKIQEFKKPIGDSFISIYKLNNTCKGKTLQLSMP